MNANKAEPLVPTFTGFVHDTWDALILFEACLIGKIHYLPRRLDDQERSKLIESGNVFIYEEKTSGIKRWTDGIAWSPSRILGNFMIYRELDKPFPPGEKKRAIKQKRSSLPHIHSFQRGHSDNRESVRMPRSITPPEALVNEQVNFGPLSSTLDRELERSLIGSLVDSYGFRAKGLVKKTMSISVNNLSLHMVSYYKVEDVKQDVLARPLQDPRLQHISVRPELYLKQNFRAPIDETGNYPVHPQGYANPQVIHPIAVKGDAMSLGQYYSTGQYLEAYPHQTMYPMAANQQNMGPAQYNQGGWNPGMYAPMATSNAGHAAMYSTMPGTHWAQQPVTSHPSYTAASSYGGYYRSGSQSGANPAELHASSQLSGYSNLYPASYAAGCYGSHSSSGIRLRSPFQSPVQPGSSTFDSMSAPTGPAESKSSNRNPISNDESHHEYSTCQGHRPSFP